jgi:hypothetical protein
MNIVLSDQEIVIMALCTGRPRRTIIITRGTRDSAMVTRTTTIRTITTTFDVSGVGFLLFDPDYKNDNINRSGV